MSNMNGKRMIITIVTMITLLLTASASENPTEVKDTISIISIIESIYSQSKLSLVGLLVCSTCLFLSGIHKLGCHGYVRLNIEIIFGVFFASFSLLTIVIGGIASHVNLSHISFQTKLIVGLLIGIITILVLLFGVNQFIAKKRIKKIRNENDGNYIVLSNVKSTCSSEHADYSSDLEFDLSDITDINKVKPKIIVGSVCSKSSVEPQRVNEWFYHIGEEATEFIDVEQNGKEFTIKIKKLAETAEKIVLIGISNGACNYLHELYIHIKRAYKPDSYQY